MADITKDADTPLAMPDEAAVNRAIKLSYAQVMLGAVFGASTGGMFLTGFAIQLGADNVALGLMSTIPACFVVFQFLAAWLVERGISRKRITVIFAFLAPLCWLLIGIIPFFQTQLGPRGCLMVLIGILGLVTLAWQFAGNARGSWIGELIPEKKRGKFFGYCGMFGGLVGAVFAVLEGRFLDFIKSCGLMAFTGLFFFGVVFGLITACLHLPQPDCPLPGGKTRTPYLTVLGSALRNRNFVMLAVVHAVMALSGIVGPFIATYWLRDLKFGFFDLGLLNAISTVAVLAASPLWGKVIDRWGCRPVMLLGYLIWAPCPLIWLWVPQGSSLSTVWLVLPIPFFLSGLGAAAVSVAISSMIYKVSKPEGRSIQFAAYSTFVTAVGAPMPAIGGWLVTTLQKHWAGADLRITFYLSSLFLCLAAGMAWHMRDATSVRTRVIIFRYLPDRVTRLWDSLVG